MSGTRIESLKELQHQTPEAVDLTLPCKPDVISHLLSIPKFDKKRLRDRKFLVPPHPWTKSENLYWLPLVGLVQDLVSLEEVVDLYS